MSLPDPPRPTTPPTSGARYAAIFVLGLVVGLFALLVILRAVDSRRTWQDRYPLAVMHLADAHMAQLEHAITLQRCTPDTSLPHLRALGALARDLEPAFPAWRDHRGFVAHADALRHTLATATANVPASCTELATTVREIQADCRACHRDTRH